MSNSFCQRELIFWMNESFPRFPDEVYFSFLNFRLFTYIWQIFDFFFNFGHCPEAHLCTRDLWPYESKDILKLSEILIFYLSIFLNFNFGRPCRLPLMSQGADVELDWPLVQYTADFLWISIILVVHDGLQDLVFGIESCLSWGTLGKIPRTVFWTI